MKLRDLSELAARNLREAILRNSLTTLGVAVGVASLVAMLSLGVGLQTLASDRLTKSGLFDAIFVSSRRGFGGGPGGDGPRKPPADSTKDKPKENPKPLDEAARLQFAALPTSPTSTRKSASSPTFASTTTPTPPTSSASPNPPAP